MTSKKNTWEIVQIARSKDRIKAKEFIDLLFSNFFELKGDYVSGDDKATIGGVALFEKIPVTVIAQHKGVDTNDRIAHNFGMPMPEGYRKALRLMKQAEKFNRPIITIIDTPGASPSADAENRGQARAIADILFNVFSINVPIISIFLGEGGSGGALGIGISDRTIMFENSFFSVISPEGMASILYNDSSKAELLSSSMKITAIDLHELGLVDGIIEEYDDFNESVNILKNLLNNFILELIQEKKDNKLLDNRKKKYERI